MMDFKKIALFRGASESFFKDVENAVRIQKHDKGKIIFIHEEEATHFYIVKTGWIKLFRETLDGTQSIVDIMPAGHAFGETSIFQDNLYPYSAEVVEGGKIAAIPIGTLGSRLIA